MVTFVFATQIVQSLYFHKPKFQAFSHFLWLYSLVCVGPGWKPEDRFSHVRRSSDSTTSHFSTQSFKPVASCCIGWFGINLVKDPKDRFSSDRAPSRSMIKPVFRVSDQVQLEPGFTNSYCTADLRLCFCICKNQVFKPLKVLSSHLL